MDKKCCFDHVDPPVPSFFKEEKKKTCSNVTSRKLQSNGPTDSTGKIKVWFMIWEEPHYSKREHFRRNSVTTDEMLPMFGHMVKYSPSKHGLTRLLGVCTHLCEVSVLKCVGIKKLCLPFKLCETSLVGHDLVQVSNFVMQRWCRLLKYGV